MNKLIKALLATILVSQFVWAGLPPTSLKDLNGTGGTTFNYKTMTNQATALGGVNRLIETGNGNMLQDPNFQGPIATSPWTVATGVGSVDTTVKFGTFPQSLKIATTSSVFSLSQSITPTGSVQGVNMEATVWLNTTETNLKVCDLLAGTQDQCTAAFNGAGTWQPITVNFVGPASGSIGIGAFSATSQTGQVNSILGYVGPARNIGSIQTETNWIPYTPITTNFGTVTGTFWYKISADGLWLRGRFSNVSASASAASINFPVGLTLDTTKESQVSAIYGIGTNGGSAVVFALLAGTNMGNTIAFGDINTNASLAAAGGTTIVSGGVFSFETGSPIPILGSSVSPVLNTNTSPANWNGTSTLIANAVSGTFGDLTSGLSGSVTATTSQNITCAAASGQLGITCTLPNTGTYQVCWAGAASNNFVGSIGQVVVTMTDGSNNVISGPQQITSPSSSAPEPLGSCGNYNATSTTTTFKLRGNITNGTSGGVAPQTFSVVSLNTPIAAPIVIGSITTNSPSAWRIESITLAAGAGTCTLTNQSGAWVSSSVANATGDCTLNIAAGMFSAAPVCVSGSAHPGTIATETADFYSVSTSQIKVGVTFTTAAGGSTGATSDPMNIMCMGPK